MNPQKYLNELFLSDAIKTLKEQSDEQLDAVELFKRLRLYLCTAGQSKSLRTLLHENGLTNSDYDRLLRLYNKQLSGRK